MTVVLAFVSGCGFLDRGSNEPTAIRRDGTAIEVVVCADLDASLVRLEHRNLRDSEQWVVFWESDGNREIESGEPLLLASILIPDLQPDDQIRVFIRRDGGEGGVTVVNSIFYLGRNGLSDSTWLHPDGTSTTAPCS